MGNSRFLFISVFVLIFISLIAVSEKLSPSILEHSVSYCKPVLQSFHIQLPHHIADVFLSILGTIMLLGLIRTTMFYQKTITTRKALRYLIEPSPSMNSLLEKLQIRENTKVVASTTPFAFCFGIRKPKIYISTAIIKLMKEEEIETILRHEKYHLVRRDTLTMMLASISASVFFCFPLIADMVSNYKIEREIRADKEAIRGMGNAVPLALVLKKCLTLSSVASEVQAFFADAETIGPRIQALTTNKVPQRVFRPWYIFSSLFSFILVAAVLFLPMQAVEVHSKSTDVVLLCPDNSSCINVCKNPIPMSTRSNTE